jgi:endonuclease III
MLFSPVAPAPSLADAAVFCLIFLFSVLFSKHKILNNAREFFSAPNALDYVLVLFFCRSMQTAFDFKQTEDLRSIRDRLTAHFGKIRIEKRPDPVNQLVGSILGSLTRDEISLEAFRRLITHFRKNWNAIADAPEADIEGLVWDVRYPEKKAVYLKRALRIIRSSSGEINLDFLADWEAEQALCWLERIDGVGRKTSAATLNFSSLRGRTFVVDTHVLRVLRRFGFVGANASAETAYDDIMTASGDFDADDLFEMHWQIKRLGQSVCTYAHASCLSCPLSSLCIQRLEESSVIVTQIPAYVA